MKRQEPYPLSPVAIRGKDDMDAIHARGGEAVLSLKWTIAYYILLVTGVYLFYGVVAVDHVGGGSCQVLKQ